MTQGERVKEIRKHYKLTLEKFGKKVGVTKQTVSRIENGINRLTEQMTRSICREFSINEQWLRTGESEMFDELSDLDKTTEFLSTGNKEEKSLLLNNIFELNEKNLELVGSIIALFVKQQKEAEPKFSR